MGKYTDNPAAVAALVQQHQVHRDTYIDREIYELEMKHLFANTWVFVGHDSQTPNKGDYITTQIGNQPVIMVRHSDNQIYVLHNRCPHKGTKIAIDRAGNTGKFFRCPYHAWSFKTDGCLLAIPLKKGYADTGFDDSEAKRGMEPVGDVKNYRGFVFARLAKEGIGFEDFFGESLSSLDNMVDRAPEGRLEVAGPPLRYMHKCNWKMLVDNQTDTCHPMVAHESSAGTAVRLFEEATGPRASPSRWRWRSSRPSCRLTSSSRRWASAPGPTATGIRACIIRSIPITARHPSTGMRWSPPMVKSAPARSWARTGTTPSISPTS
ncbi:MAG: Rieske 2Fe-2S domain-containing protein [Paracoccaceae bacterium]